VSDSFNWFVQNPDSVRNETVNTTTVFYLRFVRRLFCVILCCINLLFVKLL